MNLLQKYDIDIARLNLGQHEFQFQIDDKFFELFDYGLLDRGKLSAEIFLDKKTSFISLTVRISGIIQLICDRSLESFGYDLATENEIVLKYGEEAREVSDEVEIILLNTQQINVAKYLYEFLSVSIPMKKLHPRYQNEPVDDQIIFSSKDDEEEKSEIDPRWRELKKLSNKK